MGSLVALLLFGLQIDAGGSIADRLLTGTVEDPSGGMVAGARVTIVCDGDTREATSGPDGAFEVGRLPMSRCVVVAETEGFQPAATDVDLTAERSAVHIRLVLAIEGFETEVVVTPGRGRQEATFELPEAVSVTTREEISERPHQLLPQVLREETGVLLQQTTTAQASPFIRGFSAQRIVYLFDGVRFNTSTFRTGATQYLGWIAPGIVQRMEVVRGPASVQYGSDALGGTVNVIGIEPILSPARTNVGGQIEGVFGSADLSGAVDADIAVRAPRFALRAGGSTRHIQDLRAGEGGDSHAAVTRFLGLPSSVIDDRLTRTGFRQSGGRVTFRTPLGPSGFLQGTYLHEEQSGVSRYDRLLGGDGLHRSEFDPQRLDFGLVRYQRSDVGSLDGVSVTFSLNRQQDDRLEQGRPSSRIERENGRVLALGYQAQGSRRLADRHDLLFGGEFYDEYIAASRVFEDPLERSQTIVRPEIPDGTRYRSLGFFAQDTADLANNRVTLKGGVRYGRFVFRTEAAPAFGVESQTVTTDAVTFHTGVVIALAAPLRATFSVNRGFRAANALDLGAIGISGGGFEIAPVDAAGLGAEVGTNDGPDAVGTGVPVNQLDPEVLYAFEGGLKLQTSRVSATFTAFDLELRDAIQRRTAIFRNPVVGTVVAGYEIVRQDAAGRGFVEADLRPIVSRVNVERARIRGLEADARVRVADDWTASWYFSMMNGSELDTDEFLRRMPPPLGGLTLRYAPAAKPYWTEGVVSFARRQTRLSPGDLSDARIGGPRTRDSIAQFFDGTATDIGLVVDGRLVSTGEDLAAVQQRVLGGESSGPLFDRTPGFIVLGVRAGLGLTADFDVTLIAENLADRNYRWHGSGVDAPGFNLQVKARYRF